MTDQAEKLRKLSRVAPVASDDVAAQLPVVVVSGAKAGVGATTVAVNLAAVLADRGERVLVVDAAQHRNDLAEVAGIGRDFEHSLSDVVASKCGIADAMVSGPAGLRVLANRSRVSPRRGRELSPRRTFDRKNSATVSDFSRSAQQRLLSELELLRDEVDLIVIDAGCGLTAWTRRFWLRGQLVVLVTTVDDAAVLDAYAAIKLSARDGIRPVVRLLVNQSESDEATAAAHCRIENACQRFLSCSIEALQALPRHAADAVAGGRRSPRVWEAPGSAFGHAALWLGRAVGEASGQRVSPSCATACGETIGMEMLSGTARC